MELGRLLGVEACDLRVAVDLDPHHLDPELVVGLASDDAARRRDVRNGGVLPADLLDHALAHLAPAEDPGDLPGHQLGRRHELERSAPWLPRIRALGLPAALVAQDGLEELEVPWDTFDVLFIGGSDAFKLGPAAAQLVAEAKARGKRVHMGRVNSWKRMSYADAIGCDTADGTYIGFGPAKNTPKVIGWMRRLRTAQLELDSPLAGDQPRFERVA